MRVSHEGGCGLSYRVALSQPRRVRAITEDGVHVGKTDRDGTVERDRRGGRVRRRKRQPRYSGLRILPPGQPLSVQGAPHLHCSEFRRDLLLSPLRRDRESDSRCTPRRPRRSDPRRLGLPRQTTQTITDRNALLEELEQVRERGVAFADEYVDGLREVGRCVRGPDGRVLGAVAIIGPKYRFTDDRYTTELPAILAEYVDDLEATIEDSYLEEFR